MSYAEKQQKSTSKEVLAQIELTKRGIEQQEINKNRAIEEFTSFQELHEVIHELSVPLNYYLERTDLAENEGANKSFQYSQLYILLSRLYEAKSSIASFRGELKLLEVMQSKGVQKIDL